MTWSGKHSPPGWCKCGGSAETRLKACNPALGSARARDLPGVTQQGKDWGRVGKCPSLPDPCFHPSWVPAAPPGASVEGAQRENLPPLLGRLPRDSNILMRDCVRFRSGSCRFCSSLAAPLLPHPSSWTSLGRGRTSLPTGSPSYPGPVRIRGTPGISEPGFAHLRPLTEVPPGASLAPARCKQVAATFPVGLRRGQRVPTHPFQRRENWRLEAGPGPVGQSDTGEPRGRQGHSRSGLRIRTAGAGPGAASRELCCPRSLALRSS